MVSQQRIAILILPAMVTVALVLSACGGTSVPEPPGPTPVQPAQPASEPAAPAESPAELATGIPPSPAPDGCVETRPHPVGQSTAETYDNTTYDEVMTWFCEGNSFEDILLALETNAQSGVATDDLLARRAQGIEWNQIWQDIGLIEPPE